MFQNNIVLILYAILILNIFCNVNSTRSNGGGTQIFDTTNGKIRGATSVSRAGKVYNQFLGIPYAKPPVGELRFEPPHRIGNWTGIKDTMSFRKPCIQFENMFVLRVQGLEDCLYLNVFTPQVDSQPPQRLRSVMVFIHGGGFMSGNPSLYKGKYLVDEDIVLVTMSYRLASFGFLSTGDDLIRGNLGLRDQNLALRWVQENIKFFGGSPERVTLFGESSGAASVHLHMLSPMSTGLFYKAILQSGSALRQYPLTNDPGEQARSFASRLGCPVNNSTQMVNCLKTVSAIAMAELHRESSDVLKHDYSIYGPIIETVQDGNTFLAENPYELLKRGRYNKVPMIVGANSADGILFSKAVVKDEQAVEKLKDPKLWEIYLPNLLRYDDNANQGVSAAESIRDYYFGFTSPTDSKNFQNLTDMFSDRMHFLPAHRAAELQSPHSPVYLYYFDYRTSVSVLKLVEAVQQNLRIIPAEVQIARYFIHGWINENLFGIKPPFYGAAHADELFLLFNLNFILESRPGSRDYEASRAMVQIWADFAKNDETDEVQFDGKPWIKTTPDKGPMHYLRIGEKKTMILEPFEKRLEFWESLNLTRFGQKL